MKGTTTKAIRCTCNHEGQDKLHGKGMRLHNATQKGSGGTVWRCTICLKERTG